MHLCTHLGKFLGVELSGLEAIHIAKELQCQFVLQKVVSLACNSNTWDLVSGRLGVQGLFGDTHGPVLRRRQHPKIDLCQP